MDGELVQLVRGGDREAFGELIERHHGYVYGMCLRLVGEIGTAEELAHDAFVEAYLKLDQLRTPDHFRPWLRQIALNLCRALWRQRSRYATDELIGELAAAPPDDDGEDLLAKLAAGLRGLSQPHRLVLTLHYLEGLSYADIGRFLDVPVGTVMSRLHRARSALRRQTETAQPTEDVPVIPNDEFRTEVDAEIDVLMDMFAGKADEAERLVDLLETTANGPAAAKALYREPGPDRSAPLRPHRIRGMARPFTYADMEAAVRYATPELREYDEAELTEAISRICVDYALTRRNLVDCGLMNREDGTYRFTTLGERVWRVEHQVLDNYLR